MGWGGTRREDHDLAPDLLLDAVAADLQLMVRGEAGVATQQPDAVRFSWSSMTASSRSRTRSSRRVRSPIVMRSLSWWPTP